MLFDSHAHLNDNKFNDDIEDVLARCKENGVLKLATVGYDYESSLKAVKLAKKYDPIYAVIGVHPHDADSYCDEMEELFEKLSKEDKVVAIGEIGLDYYRDLTPRDIQQIVFRRQIKLAQRLNMPIVVHTRDAMEDTIKILKQEQEGQYKGIIHCYSGSYEQTKDFIDMGFYISIAGPITYPNSKKLPIVAKNIPIDRLLIETDCPYLTPQAYRGKRNEPGYVRYVAECIADIREMTYDDVCRITYDNACSVFAIK